MDVFLRDIGLLKISMQYGIKTQQSEASSVTMACLLSDLYGTDI